MTRQEFIREMPKVELHVHLEGSIQPKTVLKLAKKNGASLPASDVQGLRDWYRFTGFPHFIEVYVAITKTIKDVDDLDLIAREFLLGQAKQNVRHSEVTYSASTIEKYLRIPFDEQIEAIGRARKYGEQELGVTMGLIIDIVRGDSPERGLDVARWAVSAKNDGVVALGLAGEEGRAPSSQYVQAFDYALSHDLPVIPHAGETQGAWSVRECLKDSRSNRIGHGVRCIEDASILDDVIKGGVTLEVCPSSNVCLGVYRSMEEHVLPQLINAGCKVTINSDDPPLFGTSITDEFLRVSDTFGYCKAELVGLTQNAIDVSLCSKDRLTTIQAQLDAFVAANGIASR